MSAPWFKDGVPFRCLGPECGDCCSGKHGPGAVWVNAKEMAALAQHLGLGFDDFTRRYVRSINGEYSLVEKPNFDCAFYEAAKGCTVYAARPSQCRTYPFWSKVMAAKLKWDSEAEVCPGIGVEGASSPGSEVEALLAEDQARFPDGRPSK